MPDAVEPLPSTDWESPNTDTTHPSSSLPREEGPEQGSELPNTSLLDDNLHTLPPYPQIHEPSFTWGNVDGATLTHAITCCYNEVVHWKRNLFKVPFGKARNSFVKELTRLTRAYAEASALEAIALKAAMVMPHLLLQKSHHTSKAKDHVVQLERRLKSWAEGDIDQLLHEGHTIQRQLISSRNPKQEEQSARTFSRLMMEGKVKAALWLISDQEKGSVLPLDSLVFTTGDTPAKTVRDILLEKHPPAKPLVSSAVYEPNNTIPEPHPIHFDRIDGPLIDPWGQHRLCRFFW